MHGLPSLLIIELKVEYCALHMGGRLPLHPKRPFFFFRYLIFATTTNLLLDVLVDSLAARLFLHDHGLGNE